MNPIRRQPVNPCGRSGTISRGRYGLLSAAGHTSTGCQQEQGRVRRRRTAPVATPRDRRIEVSDVARLSIPLPTIGGSIDDNRSFGVPARKTGCGANRGRFKRHIWRVLFRHRHSPNWRNQRHDGHRVGADSSVITHKTLIARKDNARKLHR